VIDLDDDPALHDELHRRADVSAGVIVVRPVPGTATRRSLANDVLIALGKHFDAVGRERQTGHGWDLARLWLRAERIGQLVVCDSERLSPELLGALADLASDAGSHLWLIARSPLPAGCRPALRPSQAWRPEDLLDRLPVVEMADGPAMDRDLVLPRDNFLTFRAACKRLLAARQFSVVDAVYMAAYDETQESLFARAQRDRPSREEVVSQLRRLTCPSLSAPETIVRLRAAQAAYFVDGALVEVTEARRPKPVDLAGVGLSRQVASRLRRLVSPAWAGALALSTIGGLGAVDLARLNLGAIDEDGERVTVGAGVIEIPAYAAGLLRAQLIARAGADRRGNEPLFVNKHGARFDPAILRRRLEAATTLAALWWGDALACATWQTLPAHEHGVEILALSERWKLVAGA